MNRSRDQIGVGRVVFTFVVLAAGACQLKAAPPTTQYVAKDLYVLTPPSGIYPFFVQTMDATGKVGGYGHDSSPSQNYRAIFQSGPGTAVDLTPSYANTGVVNGIGGGQEVGTLNNNTAVLWAGTAASAVSLARAGFLTSIAIGTNGAQQVGYGTSQGAPQYHNEALLWRGTAASAVSLHPAGFRDSYAFGTDGTHQVGSGQVTFGGSSQALLWTGTAASVVDLQPLGFTASSAQAVSGNVEVGQGQTAGGSSHAILWRGTALSAVDLQPTNLTGFTDSFATATNGGLEVGAAYGADGLDHAVLWNGAADSAVDLSSLLPGGFAHPATYAVDGSEALAVDAQGNVFGYATDALGNVHAIEWAVPEPTSIPLIVLGAASVLTRLTRRR